MIKTPFEVREAGGKALYEFLCSESPTPCYSWSDAPQSQREDMRIAAENIFGAMVRAWPNADVAITLNSSTGPDDVAVRLREARYLVNGVEMGRLEMEAMLAKAKK